MGARGGRGGPEGPQLGNRYWESERGTSSVKFGVTLTLTLVWALGTESLAERSCEPSCERSFGGAERVRTHTHCGRNTDGGHARGPCTQVSRGAGGALVGASRSGAGQVEVFQCRKCGEQHVQTGQQCRRPRYWAMANPTPCLDFFSPDFDALAALRTKGLQPPNPRVRPLDNLNKCRRILPVDVPESLANAPIREPRSQESIAAQQRAKARTSLILEKAAERARQAKVLDTIADKLRQGPLGLLVRCYEERARIQVWTRHTHGIRGTMVGFVRALDKHFNMVMHDVDEQYSGKSSVFAIFCEYRWECSDVRGWHEVLRRVPRLVNKRGRMKVPQHKNETAENLPLDEVGEDWNGNLKKEQISVGVESLTERMKELKLFPKLEHRRRHLKQVFVRGDSVVMVRKVV